MLTNSSINQTDQITSMIEYNLHKTCIILMSLRIDGSDCFFISLDTHFFGQDTFTDAPVIYRLVWKKQLSTFAIEFSII